MDTMNVLVVIEASLIIAAILFYKAMKLISPSLHACPPVAIDSSNNDALPIPTAPSLSSIDFAKYEVFLSFRGDTRDNFTSHLYQALLKAKIRTFIDDSLKKGQELWPVLKKKIEESEIYVIVFSEDYASSTWCLKELVKILKCKKKHKREVIPVFYKVDPSNIRKQSGSYGDAFLKHEHRFKNKQHKIRSWKDALTQVANLNGWDSKNIRSEAKLIEEIVKDVLSKLKGIPSCYFEGLVGIHERVEEIKALLSIVRIVGIWGMGGIGKSTLAKAVFHDMRAQFESCCFVHVREELERNGLDQLQKKCLSELLKDDDIDAFSFKRLGRTKILLVLDDVDNFIQVKDLINLCDWFGPESRIIITSRDLQVLKNTTPCDGAYKTYHVQEMSLDDAHELFFLRAFKQNKPTSVDYTELSECAVNYCQGNPLAITVLGCFLYGRRREEWISALEYLKQAPDDDIFNVLRLSFDGLNDNLRNVFLDLACFFKGKNEIHEESIQNYYCFSTKIVIKVLRDRSFISINKHNYIVMHPLVRAMGQKISCQEFIAGNAIHLWKHKDIYHFLRSNKGSETIRGIFLDMCEIRNIFLKAEAFENMDNMVFLRFFKSDPKGLSKVHFLEGLKSLPEELRILYWVDYPLPYVPLNFCAENLVTLKMRNSNLQQLWSEDLYFPNLKFIDLMDSKHLVKLSDLSQAPNIEEILVEGSVNLLQIYSSKPLAKLRTLWLNGCKKLRSAEILTLCPNLKHLQWDQCPLQSLALSSCYLENLVELSLRGNKLQQLWDGQQYFPNLNFVILERSKYLIQTSNRGLNTLSQCMNSLQLYSLTTPDKLLDTSQLISGNNSQLMRRDVEYTSKFRRRGSDFSWLEYLSIENFEVEKHWNENQRKLKDLTNRLHLF